MRGLLLFLEAEEAAGRRPLSRIADAEELVLSLSEGIELLETAITKQKEEQERLRKEEEERVRLEEERERARKEAEERFRREQEEQERLRREEEERVRMEQERLKREEEERFRKAEEERLRREEEEALEAAASAIRLAEEEVRTATERETEAAAQVAAAAESLAAKQEEAAKLEVALTSLSLSLKKVREEEASAAEVVKSKEAAAAVAADAAASAAKKKDAAEVQAFTVKLQRDKRLSELAARAARAKVSETQEAMVDIKESFETKLAAISTSRSTALSLAGPTLPAEELDRKLEDQLTISVDVDPDMDLGGAPEDVGENASTITLLAGVEGAAVPRDLRESAGTAQKVQGELRGGGERGTDEKGGGGLQLRPRTPEETVEKQKEKEKEKEKEKGTTPKRGFMDKLADIEDKLSKTKRLPDANSDLSRFRREVPPSPLPRRRPPACSSRGPF